MRHGVRVSLTRFESIQTDDPFGRRGSSTRSQVVPPRTRALRTSSATGPPSAPVLVEIVKRSRPAPGADQAGVAVTMCAIHAARAVGAAGPVDDVLDGLADEAFAAATVARTVASTAIDVPITRIARAERTGGQPVTADGGTGGSAPTSFTVARTLCL